MVNWVEESNTSKFHPSLKIKGGETREVVFSANEADEYSDKKTGTNHWVFTVKQGEEVFCFYVNKKNFSTLKQLAAIIPLHGKKAAITRTGTQKTDTRYSIKLIE